MSRAAWRDSVDRSWTGAWKLPDALRAQVSDDERLALVALSMSGVGPASLANEVGGEGGILGAVQRRELAPAPLEAARRLTRAGARAVLPCDRAYPPSLLETDAPPPLLFVRGDDPAALQPCAAVVGARVCSAGGARFAAQLAGALAASGFTVVSGLARGIDAAAHQGALRSGRTVAVLGTGIDIVYPSEHRDLANAVAGSGCVLSEFPPGVRPRAWHFPARNRIIAGMSIAVVVVEAAERSGALITADFALDAGREVFACTVSPTNPAGAGVRGMLRDGARLVLDADSAADDICQIAADLGHAMPERRPGSALPPDLAGESRQVYEAVLEQTTVDEIAERTALPVQSVVTALAGLELEGVIADDGGGRWRRTR